MCAWQAKCDITKSKETHAYPGFAHNTHSYPWDIHFSDTTIRVQSNDCTGQQTKSGTPCASCAGLLKNPVIKGIEDHNRHGFTESTPYKWLTMADAIELLQKKNAQINQLKLSALNMARSLLSRASHLDAHKTFLWLLVKATSRESIGWYLSHERLARAYTQFWKSVTRLSTIFTT
jgi:hypothetical protein